MFNFTVYSKPGCPYCVKIIELLSHLSSTKGFSIVEYSLNEHFNKEEFYAQFGEGSTFPQVVLNGDTNLGGCSDTIKYLKENNII